MIIGLIIVAVIVYGVLHLGHHGARRRGERGLTVYWNSRPRRPYVSVPLPGGFRIGHRL
jgi:hypothetical protein